MIPEAEEKYTVRLDKDVDPSEDAPNINKSIVKVVAKAHERTSAAANVAIHADRFDDYDRRKQWNEWALQTYRDVTQGRSAVLMTILRSTTLESQFLTETSHFA
jgi:hypothetical protein